MSRSARLLSLLSGLLLLAAACGTNDDPGAAGGGGATGAPGEEQTAAAGDVSGELTVWAMGTEGERLGEFADQFMEEYPDVEVSVTPIAWDVAHDRLITSVAGGESPDVTQLGTTWMGEFAAIGALQPVPSDFDTSRFFEGAMETATVDGTAYGVPWYVETRLLYYRTDLAEEAGIEMPPTTWDELKAAAQAYKDAGNKNGMSLVTGVGSNQTYLTFLWSAGGDVLADDGTFTLDSPEAVEAIEYYASFFTDGITEPMAEGFDITQGFVQGTYPMFLSGPWHMALIRDTGGEEFEGNWDIAPLPANDSATSFLGGSDLAVFQNTDNPDAAWAFVEYLSRPEVQAQWYEAVAALPAHQDAWQSGDLASDEALQMFGEQLETAKAPPAIPTWAQVEAAIDTEIEEAALGGKSPQDAAAAIQQAAESIGTEG
jgi:multiple sugar transport system substrate-binding protein